tara:strand:+ start:86 stop:499 length:414 start_codon:yes stop_codon:yes gene_type:complete
MSLQERYNRLTPAQKREFQRMRKPSMLTNWKQLTDEQIITRLEKDAKKVGSSEFASIASRPKVLQKSQWQEVLKRKRKKKRKSTVNQSGNYTKPGMRKRMFQRIKAGSKGGRPGQWSARKAQLLAQRYKKAGGGYKN